MPQANIEHLTLLRRLQKYTQLWNLKRIPGFFSEFISYFFTKIFVRKLLHCQKDTVFTLNVKTIKLNSNLALKGSRKRLKE